VDLPEFDINDPVSVYVNEVCKVPPLTSEEEVDLLRHIQDQDAQAELAKKRLVEANLLLVVNIAMSHRSSGIHILDLIQEGNNGLLSAVKTLANSSGPFSIHTAACIEQAIKNRIAQG